MGPLLLSRLLGLNETQSGVLTLAFKVADDENLALLDLKDLRAMIQNIGEPMLNIHDLIQSIEGKGVVNLLDATKLMNTPKLYASLLLWILSELFEVLPEAGISKSQNSFFFDEAHLLFSDASDVLVEKIEQVVRLIRSKGVGIYFITQHPGDIPERIAAQLGNRVAHALRAFTPKDQKAVRAAAETMRDNKDLDEHVALMELGVGEALMNKRLEEQMVEKAKEEEAKIQAKEDKAMNKPSARGRESAAEALAKSAERAIGSQLGRTIIRGILGSIFKR